MNVPEIEFDWDEANVGHVDRHAVLPEEAEQVILNDPVALGMEILEGEERYVNLGATARGRYRVRADKEANSALLPGTKEVIRYGQEILQGGGTRGGVVGEKSEPYCGPL
jgi:hypothetical protein